VKRINRKEWGVINPRKSIGKKRDGSKETRPRAFVRISK